MPDIAESENFYRFTGSKDSESKDFNVNNDRNDLAVTETEGQVSKMKNGQGIENVKTPSKV